MKCRVRLPILVGSILFSLATRPSPWADAAERPNVLVILADDQRFDTVHALGNDEIHAPNLNMLVNRGFVFANAYLYEPFKSPLIIAGPGIPRGKSDALVYLFDLFPTLCDLAGIATPPEADGSSLAPIIKGERPRVREWLLAAYRDCQRMVRDERWKLIWYPKIDRYQLFDLAADPWEINDLSAEPEHTGKLSELKRQLANQQRTFGDNMVPPPIEQ